MTAEQLARTERILEKFGSRGEAMLIAILQEVQKEERYLPREILESLSRKMDIPMTRIYAIATFYKSFSLKPRGRHQIKVCTGTACHIKGAAKNRDEIMRRLGISDGEVTADRNFSVETVNCLGTCALAPVIVVDDQYYDGITPAKIKRTLEHYSENHDE
jgi:NADH-quinone oxidoreductase subunit E